MDDTLEIQKIKIQAAVYSIAINAIYSALSATQRDIALTVFRSTTEKAQRRLEEEEAANEAVQLFCEICGKVEREMSGR